MISIILIFLKYILLIALIPIVYVCATMIIPQYFTWRKYKKYRNVYTTPKFIPLLGDFYTYAKNMSQGKTYYAHLDDKTKILKDYDMELIFEGPTSVLQVVSHEAHREFEYLQPDSIDRYPELTSVGQMMSNTFGNGRSDEDFHYRKKSFFKLLSFNRSSHYIPMMVEGLERLTTEWVETGRQVDVIGELFRQNFSVLTQILFGRDTGEIMKKKRPFKQDNGEYVMLDLCQLFLRTTDAYVDQYLSPFTIFMPFVNKYKLVEPFKRNAENNETLRKAFREAIAYTKDESSVLYSLRDALKDTDPEGMLDDLVGVTMAGIDTSAHAFCATLYFLKTHPEKLVKLQKELADNGLDGSTDMIKHYNKNTIEKLNYLHCVVKEALRLDPPAIDSLNYICVKDCKICGVDIKKGQRTKINLFASNHSYNDYHRPFEFMPERFEPESEYFTRPADGKPRSVYSYIPFSHGLRGCPGLSYAVLQIRVAIGFVCAKLDCEVDPELMKKEGVGFAVRSGFDMHATFTRR